MNPQTPPQAPQPYTNGHYETPLELSGVSLRRPAAVQKPTVFAKDLPVRGMGPIFYALHRFHFNGLPFARYMVLLWILLAALAALNVLPGRWFTASLLLLIGIIQIILNQRYRQRKYITFTPATAPVLNESPLTPSEKLPIYATGLLSVEGRYQHYSALPGFYRTFATGEHAILCRVQERNWLGLLSWPHDEIGMWYAFVKPTEIERLAWGTLHFGSEKAHALEIEYQLEIPPSPRRKRTELRREILYIATSELKDAQRVYIDLLNNLPDDKIVNALSTKP